MRRRVRGSRGTKWRWGPHISSPWLKGRENEKDGVTVPTACGIETYQGELGHIHHTCIELQQCLPLAVLQLFWNVVTECSCVSHVATVLTACGIETSRICTPTCGNKYGSCNSAYRLRYWNKPDTNTFSMKSAVATVLTACGIETLLY